MDLNNIQRFVFLGNLFEMEIPAFDILLLIKLVGFTQPFTHSLANENIAQLKIPMWFCSQ